MFSVESVFGAAVGSTVGAVGSGVFGITVVGSSWVVASAVGSISVCAPHRITVSVKAKTQIRIDGDSVNYLRM